MSDRDFTPPPRDLDADSFEARFGGVYEHSPWIARALLASGLDERHDTVDGLAAGLRAVVEAAPRAEQMALLRAHPDLADRAAQRGSLTAASSGEQASAGLDQCTPEEYERFHQLNDDYKTRFGFPFIMAVKGYHRREILEAFERRVSHDRETEFRRALDEVHRIARLRLQAIADGD